MNLTRRTIIDKETKAPLQGAHVFRMKDGEETLIATSDLDGNVNLFNVGRNEYIKVSFVGYKDLYLTAGTLAYEMEVDVQKVDEAVVVGKKSKPKKKNYMPYIVAGVLLLVALALWKKEAIMQFFGK